MRLCLLAKWPVPGRVKTRLIPALGPEGAAEIAAAFLSDAVTALALHHRPLVALSGDAGELAAASLTFASADIIEQGGGDLGERMVRLLRRACLHAPSAAVLGSDVVGLPASHIEEAALGLERVDVVLGPTTDGGYYLLGARREALDALSTALEEVRFGTAHALSDTRRGLARVSLRTTLLSPHFDVDEPVDLSRLRAYLEGRPDLAPSTASWLARLSAAEARRAGSEGGT